MDFVPFFFDGNRWFKLVNGVKRWRDLLHIYKLEDVLDAKIAPLKDIKELPAIYHFGTPRVRTGEIPSFGFRREHIDGVTSLEEWAESMGMDLRTMAVESKEE